MKTNAKIYVMLADDGTIKLGHSRNPHARAKKIGRRVEVIHVTDLIEQAERVERLAHRILALDGRHIRGEWFEAELEQAIRAIQIAVRQAEREELALGGKLSTEGLGRPPMDGQTMVQISIRLTRDQLEWIDGKALQLGVSRNDALRFLLDRDRSWDDAR